MYAYLIFHMRGEFFDAMLEEWVIATKHDMLDMGTPVDFDMMYCGGGPL